MGDTYKKSQGTAGLEGVQFQLDLICVCLLNALHHHKDWKISTEDPEAGKYDDIVIKLTDEAAILVQAKHKEKRKITKDQLLSHNSKNADFSLPKYFFSYQEIKSKFKAKTVIVCTNSDINPKGLENMITSQRANPENLLHYESNSCSFFTFSENILLDLRTNSEIFFDKNLQNKNIEKAVITNENMKDFLKNLQFFSSYPDGNNLHKIIEQLLSRLNYPHRWSKTSYYDIYRKVEKWFKQPKGEYLTEPLAKAWLCEIRSDKYCESLENYKVSFDPMDFHFIKSKRIFHVKSEDGYLLQMLKIYQALQENKGKKLFVNPDDNVEVQKRIIEAFELRHYEFLIMPWSKIRDETVLKEISCKLKEILENHGNKKVILVAKSNKTHGRMGLTNIFQIDGSVTFENLSKESQEKLLSTENIVFQGRRVSLEELLESETSDDHLKSLDSTTLERLIKGEPVRVGVRPLDLDEDTALFYINRLFERDIDEREKGEGGISEDSIFDVKEKMVIISDRAGMGKTTILTKLAATVKESYWNLWVIKVNCNDYTTILSDCLKKKKETISVTELLNSEKATKIRNHLEELVFSMKQKVVLMLDGVDEISPDYTELIVGLLAQCQQATNFAKIFITTRPHVVPKLKAVLKVGVFNMIEFTEKDQIEFLSRYWMHNLQLDYTNTDKCECYASTLIRKMLSWLKYYYWRNPFAAVPLQARMLAEIFKEKGSYNSMNSFSLDWEGCMEYIRGNEAVPKLPEEFDIVKLYDMFIEKKRDLFIDKENPSGKAATNKVHIDKFEECLAYHRSLALEVILDETKVDLFPKVSVSDENIEYMLRLGIAQKLGNKLHFIHRTFAEYFVAKSILKQLQQEPNVAFQRFLIDDIFKNSEFKVIRVFLDNLLQEVLDFLPCNIFQNYLSLSYEMKPSKDISAENLIFILSKEGCLAILQLILKTIDFKIVKGKVIDVKDWKVQRGIKRSNALKELQLLVREAGVNIRAEYGDTPLHMAAERGSLGLVRFLIDKGADVNIRKVMGSTALYPAIQSGALDVVKYLVDAGIDINIRSKNGQTVLHHAALWSQLDIVKYLVELGMNINVRCNGGSSVLHSASKSGALNIIKYLVELGVDINIRSNKGRTAMYFTTLMGGLDTIKYFVELGIDINDTDNYGCTILHSAVQSPKLYFVKYLVELGIDINIKNNKGRTALHCAAQWGSLDTIKYLVEKGIDVNVKSSDGCTALNIAANSGRLDIVKYLEQVGVGNGVQSDSCG